MARVFEEFYDDLKDKNLPENFTIYEVSLVGGDGKFENFTHSQVKGAIFETVTRGRRAGEPNWRKKLVGSDRTYYVEIKNV